MSSKERAADASSDKASSPKRISGTEETENRTEITPELDALDFNIDASQSELFKQGDLSAILMI
ncbi:MULTISPECIES: hypothetical protein [unclassified Sinorhizobium]|uniref:hypothetical protein n=1 Tax=unclassified Sinorhizobium TaxID=2613772 RepID=UPI003524689F